MHVSEDDTVLITTTPLSEMVWSQSEGLNLRYVAPGLGDTKGSVIWDTESFNIVVSSPKCTNVGECSNSKDLAEGDINPLQLKSYHATKNYDHILCCSPINSTSSGGSVIRLDEHDSRTSGDLKLSKKIEVDLAQIFGKKQSADKVVSSSVNALQTPEKFFDSGPVKSDMLIPNVECESDDGCSLTKCGRSLKSSSSAKSAEYGYIDVCSKDQSFRASHKEKSVLIGSRSTNNLNRSSRGKGKAQVLSDTEDRESTSKASEDSHDSVESCNRKRPMSRGKRASNYDLRTSIENKRSKKQIFKGSSSNSLSRQTGSFMNWALTITKGFSRFCEATPLRSAPPVSNISHGDMGFKSIFESIYRPGSNVKNTTTSNEILQNLWVTRFSRKVSSTTENPNRMQCMEVGSQSSTKSYDALEPLSQNHALGSSFARRLGMHRSSKLSEVPHNVTLAATTCFFCGKSSHGMTACT